MCMHNIFSNEHYSRTGLLKYQWICYAKQFNHHWSIISQHDQDNLQIHGDRETTSAYYVATGWF